MYDDEMSSFVSAEFYEIETEFVTKLKDLSLDIIKKAAMCESEQNSMILGFASILALQVITDYGDMIQRSQETVIKRLSDYNDPDSFVSYFLELLNDINGDRTIDYGMMSPNNGDLN